MVSCQTVVSAGIGEEFDYRVASSIGDVFPLEASYASASPLLQEVNVCALEPLDVSLAYTNDTLGKRSAKKGKKVPASHIRGLLQERDQTKLCIEGPSFVGKTTLL